VVNEGRPRAMSTSTLTQVSLPMWIVRAWPGIVMWVTGGPAGSCFTVRKRHHRGRLRHRQRNH